MEKLTADNIIAKATKQAPVVQELLKRVKAPKDVHQATKDIGIGPRLLNYHLASSINSPLGQALYIPVQIASHEGGRESLYLMKPGEDLVMGILIIGTGIYENHVRRETGKNGPAQSGDEYTSRIIGLDGRVHHEAKGVLEVLDTSRGVGYIRYVAQGGPSTEMVKIWVAWSCIGVEIE